MSRGARVAANESLFRGVNEQLERLAPADPRTVVSFLCECADLDCRERVAVARVEYENVRSDPTHFLVLRAHVDPSVEVVVREADGHAVVRKEREAAAVAEELDPRA